MSASRARRKSCGILVLSSRRELLLCHATGTARWDIPKGLAEAGESERDAALRETFEETGLVFEPAQLHDLGLHPYLRDKDLHLYATLADDVDPARCTCSTGFEDARGRWRPEMDGHAWVGFDDVPARCGKSLAALLAGRVSLPALLATLRAQVRSAEAAVLPRGFG